jgi:hypothetical protein
MSSVSDQKDHHVLYAGPDLKAALEKSRAANPRSSSNYEPTPRISSVSWAARAAVRHATRSVKNSVLRNCREIQCRGIAEGIGNGVKIRYVGTGKNFAFLLDTFFKEYEVLAERSLPITAVVSADRRPGSEDIFITDLDATLVTPVSRGLIVPPWIKQRLQLPVDWHQFIASLPRKTRQELTRYLRKYKFKARINDSDHAYARFYRELYSPHIAARHIEQAVIVDEPEFYRDCAGTTLIELLHDGHVIAANVVRASGNCLYILWCGMSDLVNKRNLKGATDALDYFSIVYAACGGLSVVDLGRRRPRLNDGLLRYKAKWGAEIYLGRLRVAPIRIVPRNLRAATATLLANSAWIARDKAILEGRIFVNDAPLTEERIERLRNEFLHKGIRQLWIGAIKGLSGEVEAGIGEGVEVADLRTCQG